METIISKARSFTVDINSDDEADDMGEEEAETATVNCVTCGIGVIVRNAIRHIWNDVSTNTKVKHRSAQYFRRKLKEITCFAISIINF